MIRRPKGTGTIETTRDGRYRARFAFDGVTREDVDGGPFPSRAAAAAALDGVLAVLASAPVSGLSLLKLGERALNYREKAGYKAVSSDRNVWKTYVESWDLASDPAKTISRGDIRERIASLRLQAGGLLATQTKRNVRNVISLVYAYGVDNEVVSENPCDGLKIRHHGSTVETSTFLTRSEVDALLAVVTDPAVAIAIGSGLRSGELRSLKWEDVRLSGSDPEIIVRYGAPEEPTKNGKIRHVPLFGVALDALRKAHAVRTGPIVLPSLSDWYRQKGRVVHPRQWREWKTAAGLTRRVRWQDLRHTCATLLLTGGWGSEPWSYEAVKDMLGHSSVKVTERYARSASLANAAATKMTKRSRRKPETSPQVPAQIMNQAREIVERRGSDSNRRMTVLQTVHAQAKTPNNSTFSGLARAYVEAVAAGDPLSHARGLDLAMAVLDAVSTDVAVSA